MCATCEVSISVNILGDITSPLRLQMLSISSPSNSGSNNQPRLTSANSHLRFSISPLAQEDLQPHPPLAAPSTPEDLSKGPCVAMLVILQ